MLSFAGAIVMPNLVHGALNAPFAASSASTGQALQPWLCNARAAFFAADVKAEFALILPPSFFVLWRNGPVKPPVALIIRVSWQHSHTVSRVPA